MASAAVMACLAASASNAHGQVVVYETLRPVTSYYAPMAAGYPGGYMANYSPAGNYAAVTAFSPPVATGYVVNYPVASYPVTQVANYPVTQVANYAVETVASPVNVTSYYAPAPIAAAPVYAVPATTYYAPAAVAVPLYRRGLFVQFRRIEPSAGAGAPRGGCAPWKNRIAGCDARRRREPLAFPPARGRGRRAGKNRSTERLFARRAEKSADDANG
jgi:hypothetical protein